MRKAPPPARPPTRKKTASPDPRAGGVEQAGTEGLRTPSDDDDSPPKRRKLDTAAFGYEAAAVPSALEHKVRAIARICPPASALAYSAPAVAARMPLVSVDGDDVDAVAELFRALAGGLAGVVAPASVCTVDEPDDLTVLSDAYLEGLLSVTGLEKDRETDDADAARYLSHVAFWRRKSSEIRRLVRAGGAGDEQPPQPPQLVLINRYILSRSEAAALRLSTDGLTPVEHWQWCASLWRSCVGPDMTIYVQTLAEGEGGTGEAEGDAVETCGEGRLVVVRRVGGGGKVWADQVLSRLVMEIGGLVRSLRSGGFPG